MLGFIAEGDTEKRILVSNNFKSILNNLGLHFIEDVENAGGVTNLAKDKIKSLIKIQQDKGANKIIILTDSDGKCITSVKNEIDPENKNIIIVAVQMIEAWFLADKNAISTFFKKNYNCEFPEKIERPFDFIREEYLKINNRGIRNKTMLGLRMIQSGFSTENAATHPNCPSAKYFIEKLKSLAETE